MPFLTKGEFFKEYSRAVVFCVYTDKVTAIVARKEKDGVVAEARATESQEGISRGGTDFAEKILLNCEKALQALPAFARAGIQDYIVVLGAGVGQFPFTRVKWTRSDKEKKITAQEISIFLTQWHGKEGAGDAFSFRTIPQRFWIDGFAVSDAVGLNGKEITADLSIVACDNALVRSFEEFAISSGMHFRGMIDIRLAAAFWKPVFAESKSALIIILFEEEVDVLLVTAAALAGVGISSCGYGILHKEIARAFAVGKEEARGLINAFRAGALSMEPAARMREIIDSAKAALLEGVVAAVTEIDFSNILPGNIWVMMDAQFPEAEEAFDAAAWFSGLPLERNARVHIAAKEVKEKGESVFESIVLTYLSL